MKHFYIYALACVAACIPASAQCGPGMHPIPLFGSFFYCGSTLPLTIASDGTINLTKAITWGTPSTPTWNNGGTTTCDFSVSNACKVVMVGNQSTTMAFTNPHGSGPYLVVFLQDGTGGATVTYPGGVSAPSPTTAANDQTNIMCSYDGVSSYVCSQAGGTAAWRGIVAPESSAAPAAVGSDALWADSAAHRFKMSNNNGAADTVLGGATTDTLTNKTIDTAGTGNHIQIGGHDLPTTFGTANQVIQVNAGGTAFTYGTSTGTTCDPFVLTNSCLFWDMASATGLASNGNPVIAGSGLWTFLSGTPTASALAAGASTIPAGWQISSNGAANNELDLLLGPSVSTASAKFVPTSFWASAATFDLKWTLQLNTFGGVAGDNEVFFFGCTDSGLTLTNAVGIEYVSGTDTQWTARTSNAGTATKTNIAAGDTSRHNLEVKKTTTANSIQFFVDGTSVTLNTVGTIPTVGLNCGIYFKGTTTTTVTMNAFKGTLAMTALTNP